jgi:hypothetical protein
LHRPFFDVKIMSTDVIARCLLNQHVDLKILIPWNMPNSKFGKSVNDVKALIKICIM